MTAEAVLAFVVGPEEEARGLTAYWAGGPRWVAAPRWLRRSGRGRDRRRGRAAQELPSRRAEHLRRPCRAGRAGLVAEDVALHILFEDEWLLVVDKPAGMPVHPSKGHASGHPRQRSLGPWPRRRRGVPSREWSTGSTRTPPACSSWRSRWRSHRTARAHDEGAQGRPAVSGPGARELRRGDRHHRGSHRARPGESQVDGRGRAWRPGTRGRTFACSSGWGTSRWWKARLETGRTHQIRVHFLAIGHPVVGDPTYARRDTLGIGRQFLHSYRLGFSHPMTGEALDFEAPLPPDLAAVVEGFAGGWPAQQQEKPPPPSSTRSEWSVGECQVPRDILGPRGGVRRANGERAGNHGAEGGDLPAPAALEPGGRPLPPGAGHRHGLDLELRQPCGHHDVLEVHRTGSRSRS